MGELGNKYKPYLKSNCLHLAINYHVLSTSSEFSDKWLFPARMVAKCVLNSGQRLLATGKTDPSQSSTWLFNPVSKQPRIQPKFTT
jgi:hypothetical protein